MSAHPSPRSRPVHLARPGLTSVLLVLVLSSAALAEDVASPASPEPSGSPTIVPASPSADPSASDPATPAGYPLPEIVAVIPPDISTVSLDPVSLPGMTIGVAIPFTLGHCGLLSPVDLDASLWRPVGGTDASGAAITSDEAVGELINATAGEFLLLTADEATFTTPMGSVITLERASGAVEYPLCM